MSALKFPALDLDQTPAADARFLLRSYEQTLDNIDARPADKRDAHVAKWFDMLATKAEAWLVAHAKVHKLPGMAEPEELVRHTLPPGTHTVICEMDTEMVLGIHKYRSVPVPQSDRDDEDTPYCYATVTMTLQRIVRGVGGRCTCWFDVEVEREDGSPLC